MTAFMDVRPALVIARAARPPLPVTTAACSEKLLTPVNCPELCPGGQIIVYDTVLNPIPGSDTSFAGYVDGQPGHRVPGEQQPARGRRAWIRAFHPPGDSVFVQDTGTHLHHRLGRDLPHDRCARFPPAGLALLLYKLPPTVDSAATFAEINAALTPDAFIDSVEVPDTLHTGAVKALLSGETLARVALTPADSGRAAPRCCAGRAGCDGRADSHDPGGNGGADVPGPTCMPR
jgi:hypothetical protein